MALVVTLLFTGIVLLIIVSTTATLVTGSRSGGAEERRAYQALLSAESGLNTVMVRVNRRLTTTPYTGTTKAQLQTWLDGLASQPEASLFPTMTFTALDAGRFTAEARGATGNAVKVALQDYRLTSVSLPAGLRVRAALTSLPQINANGSALISGQANRGTVTTLAGSGLNASVGASQVTVTVSDSSGLIAGDYVQIPPGAAGRTFRVDSVAGSQVTLTSVPASLSSAAAYAAGTEVDLMLNAAAKTTTSVTDPLTQQVSNASDFTVGETVTVGTYTAKVTQISGSGSTPDQLTLDWISGQPAAIPEGTPILRDVAAMRSAQGISVKTNDNSLDNFTMDGGKDCTETAKKAVSCEGADDPLLNSSSAEAFFTQQIMGLTDAQLDDRVPLTLPDASGSFPPMTNAVRRIRAQDFDAALKNTTSSGVLIVDGDISSNVNGHTTFNGFIYFRGNQGGKFNGSLTVNGAIAVRGGPIEGLTSEDATTDITGNLTVKFDAVKLRQWLLTSQGGWNTSETQGTWRQR
ncbi:hypothetical protein GCM10008960_25890 [Deinococcus sedimenti]|uniref:Type 4 fimbrial biogenesis protein PilX N-terminal domain-containing protein n=1 Tax=Deinococcus sedimenti TaxID=1867090 RepID=A0ABQ2S7U9_9DEIO|nr:hypothetical protein GCM10008960_25890 [Deinococcus sedimenti]